MLAAPPAERGVSTARAALLALLAERAPGASLCPSEVARRLAGPEGDWRGEMAAVHAAVDALAQEGVIGLSWKGRPMAKRRGPYRIARR